MSRVRRPQGKCRLCRRRSAVGEAAGLARVQLCRLVGGENRLQGKDYHTGHDEAGLVLMGLLMAGRRHSVSFLNKSTTNTGTANWSSCWRRVIASFVFSIVSLSVGMQGSHQITVINF